MAQERATRSGGDDGRKAKRHGGWRKLWTIAATVIVLGMLALLGYAAARFLPDRAVAYEDIEDHFKYGSTGGDRNWGFPYWIWRVAPKVCGHLIPERARAVRGYEAFGMIYEEGRDLPVGVSKRRHLGIDRVFINCAACHTSTVRTGPDAERRLVLGMPANRFDLMQFQDFFFRCATDPKFNWKQIIPAIDEAGGDLDLIDRYLAYPLAIWFMRDLVALLESRLGFMRHQPAWGPGRVDTFNAAKAKFAWDWQQLSVRELIGTTDFPSIWNQRQRKTRDDGEPMELHWDGNNDRVEERNLSAAFGTGAIPPVTDHEAIGRIEDWLLDLKPPAFPFPIDSELASEGAEIYERYCGDCHGASGSNFSGARVGKVVPINDVGTDRWRLDSYTYQLAVNQSTLYAGYETHRFKRFRKTHGYANMPLDGIWLRAPYLHNGSVPTLRDLLEPSDRRPDVFYRGYDVYDPEKVGFVSDVAEEKGQRFFEYNTSRPGNSNIGHEGARYGTELSPQQKDALIEYLKTF